MVSDDVASVAEAPVAIVFGAGVRADGRLTPMLQDRVDTAIALYRAGKVRKLLMSGDNRTLEYNEPGRMYDYAVAQGVPPEDVVRDYAGRRTYDTCYPRCSHFRRRARCADHAAFSPAARHVHVREHGHRNGRPVRRPALLLLQRLLPPA